MKLAKVSIDRPVSTSMFYLAIILLGFVSLRQLSVDLLPDISFPRLSVVTQYSGVAPEEMETLVTAPLEAAVSGIPGLRRVESVSKEGISFLTLEFSWGTNMDFALLHTREKLDSARALLPEEAEKPNIIPLDPQSRPIFVLALKGEGTLLEQKEFAEEFIKPRLEQVEGIGQAEIVGGVEREIQVEADPRLLALYGLSIDDVAQRIAAFNRNLQGGTIRKGSFKYALRIVGEFESMDEVGEILLKTTGERGAVRLKDVARVIDSIKEREGVTRLNGQESVGILVRKEAGANTVAVTRLAKAVLAEVEKQYPRISLFVVSEQAKYIEDAISSVKRDIVYGGILAFLVILILLQDIATSLIISIVMPISIIATFNLLYFGRISLNIMSLGGLALGVGMLVDNCIVVSESIFRHKSLGRSPAEAAEVGTREVGMAVSATTLTTVVVFLPIIYVHGVAGQLFRDQAMTVTFSLMSSLLVSLTLLPMLASRRFGSLDFGAPGREGAASLGDRPPGKGRPGRRTLAKRILGIVFFPFLILRRLLYILFRAIGKGLSLAFAFLAQLALFVAHAAALPFKPVAGFFFRKFNAAYGAFISWYLRILVRALDAKRSVLIASLVFFAITGILATRIPRELMPKPRVASFEVRLGMPPEYSFEQTAEVVAALESYLKASSPVQNFFSQTGIVSGMESYDPEISVNSSKIYVVVRDPSVLEGAIESLRKRLEQYPDVRASIVREQATLEQFLAFTTAEVGIRIKGDDLARLRTLATNLGGRLKTIPGIADVNANVGEGKPELLIRIRQGAPEKYGLSPAVLSSFLVDSVRGKVATQFRELDKKYDILVRMDKDTRESLDRVLDEEIVVPGGRNLVPLRDLVEAQVVRGPQEIRRENQQREVVLTANLRGVKLSRVSSALRDRVREMALPSGYRVIFGGEQEEMGKSFRSLLMAFLVATLLVYMVMAAQFESLLHPFLIMFTLPMGLAGTALALFLTGQTLNVISTIGIVVLIGIVTDNAIVEIDFANQLRRAGQGLREAVVEAARVRLRPILMTSLTTIFGLLPMAVGLGKGSELERPLAISVMGGLVFSTFLTLVLIPMLYEAAEKRKEGRNSRSGDGEAGKEPGNRG